MYGCICVKDIKSSIRFYKFLTKQITGQRKPVICAKTTLFKAIKVIVKSDTITNIRENIKELHTQYPIYAIKKNFIPVMTHNGSAFENHLISRKLSKKKKKKKKTVTLCVVVKTARSSSFFSKKNFLKSKQKR